MRRVRDRARGSDRAVREERAVVGLDDVRRATPERGRCPTSASTVVSRRRRVRKAGSVVLVGQCRPLVPDGVAAQEVGGAQCGLLAFGNHGEEGAVAHHRDHAGQVSWLGRCRCRGASGRATADGPPGRTPCRPTSGRGHSAIGQRACRRDPAVRRWCRRRGTPSGASAPRRRLAALSKGRRRPVPSSWWLAAVRSGDLPVFDVRSSTGTRELRRRRPRYTRRGLRRTPAAAQRPNAGWTGCLRSSPRRGSDRWSPPSSRCGRRRRRVPRRRPAPVP